MHNCLDVLSTSVGTGQPFLSQDCGKFDFLELLYALQIFYGCPMIVQ